MTTPVPNPNPTGPAMPDMLPSILRTLVPVIVALLVRKGVTAWLGVDEVFASGAITAVITLAYYVGVRFLERYQSQFGWLLGFAKQPVYVNGSVVSTRTLSTPPTTTTVVQTDEQTDPMKKHPRDDRGSSDPMMALIIAALLGACAVTFVSPPVVGLALMVTAVLVVAYRAYKRAYPPQRAVR